MADTLSETRACNLLTRLFRARGYAIERNVMFREYGVEFHVDGWDAGARVGFEFLSSEDDDHDDLDLGEYQALMAAQQRGELSLFILDEVEPLDAAELTASAQEFLDEMEAAVAARRAAGRPAARTPARRAPATSEPVKRNAKKAVRRGAKKTVKGGGKKAVNRGAKKAVKRGAKKAVKRPSAAPRSARKKSRRA